MNVCFRVTKCLVAERKFKVINNCNNIKYNKRKIRVDVSRMKKKEIGGVINALIKAYRRVIRITYDFLG